MPFIPPTGIDALIDQLNKGTRGKATHELAQLGAPAISHLVAAAQGTWKNGWGVICSNDLQIRCGAIIALGIMGPAAANALPALIDLVTFDFAPLRQELVQTLAAIKKGNPDPAVVLQCKAALERLENDADYQVRYEAELALHGKDLRIESRPHSRND